MIEKITLFWGEDWEGLYINGKLTIENHSIRSSEVIKVLEAHGMEAASIEVDDDWLMAVERMPEDADDVVVAD